jgi:TetR/AcrR family transcriptional regulator, cholesterol catabolism regulator
MTAVAATRHTDATRNAILDAAVDLFIERQSDGFSIQEVADRAGLTHRTVYRYFPTRQELMGATAERIAPALVDQRFAELSTVEEWIGAVGAHFAHTEANFELARRVIAAQFTSGDLHLFGQDLRERDTHRWQIFRHQFPHLSEDDARQTFVTLRHLMSSTSYVLYRLRFGLSPTEATEAITSAASAIVEQTTRRDRAARPGRRGS